MSIDHSFRALNRYTCREVVDILRRGGSQSVAQIHSQIKIGTRANVSQALALLLKAAMVSCHHRGRQNLYQLRPAPLRELITYLKGVLRHAQPAAK